MAQATLKQHVKQTLPELCQRAAAGSPFAALLVTIEAEPDSIDELMRIVGVAARGKYRQRGFDACADAWAMYLDAKDQGIGV